MKCFFSPYLKVPVPSKVRMLFYTKYVCFELWTRNELYLSSAFAMNSRHQILTFPFA